MWLLDFRFFARGKARVLLFSRALSTICVPFNGTISFTVASGAAGQDINKNSVTAGPEGGISVESAVFKNQVGTTTAENTSDNTAKAAKMAFDLSKFNDAGVYHYTLKMNDPNINGLTDLDNDFTTTRDVYVYVMRDEEDNSLYVSNVIIMKNSDKDYTFKVSYQTNKLTIEKRVTGNSGDKTKEFDFEITITGAEDSNNTTQNPETYKWAKKSANSDNAVMQNSVITSGQKFTFKLAHNEKIEIYGLSSGDKVTFNETSVSGYTAKYYTGTDSQSSTIAPSNITLTGDTAYMVENNSETTVPTGLFYNPMTYIILIAAAAVLGTLLYRRKHAYDDED